MQQLLYTVETAPGRRRFRDAPELPTHLQSADASRVDLVADAFRKLSYARILHRRKRVDTDAGPSERLVVELRRMQYWGLRWVISMGMGTDYQKEITLDANDPAFHEGDEVWLERSEPT